MTEGKVLFFILRLLSSLFLFLAITNLPYGYYRFVRLFTFAVCVYSLYKSLEIKNITFTWIFGIIAVIFNPYYPLYLDKDLWKIIDVVSGLVILSSIKIIDNQTKQNKKIKQTFLRTYKAEFDGEIVSKGVGLTRPNELKYFDIMGNLKKKFKYEENWKNKDFDPGELEDNELADKIAELFEWLEYSYHYDEKGNIIKEFQYDSEEKLIKIKINRYGEDGEIVSSEYFDTNRKLKSRILTSYEDSIKTETTYNKDMQAISKKEYKFDNNNIIESRSYEGNKLDEIWTYKYDDVGNEIKKCLYYNEINPLELILDWDFLYDKYGNQTVWYMDFEDEITTYSYKYDNNNNWIEKVTFKNSIPEFVNEREIEYYHITHNIFKSFSKFIFRIFHSKVIVQLIRVLDMYKTDIMNDWNTVIWLNEFSIWWMMTPIEYIIHEIHSKTIKSILANTKQLKQDFKDKNNIFIYKKINNIFLQYSQEKLIGSDCIDPEVKGFHFILKRALKLKLEFDEISEKKRQEVLETVKEGMY